MRAMS